MKHAVPEVFVGGSIGLFLGLLVGMSVSPVVGIVVSGITGILAALLGISGTSSEAEAGKLKKFQLSSSARMIAFGLAASFGLFTGLWIRTHNSLSPSRVDDVRAWTAAGWPPEEARALRVYSELGLAPAGTKASADGAKSGTPSVLYSNYRDQCRNLEPRQFKDANETLNAWQLETGVWATMADVIRKSNGGNISPLLDSTWGKLCNAQ
jgi:hypothetical protein